MADIIPLNTSRQPEAMPQGTDPIFSTEINGAMVRYFVPPSDAPTLPWCVFADLGAALGWTPEQIQARTWRLFTRWLPWLKAIDTPDGSKILVPFLGAAAILAWCGGDAAIDDAILDGFAEAMDLSMADATPSERFQAMVIAARAASSPGEVNSLFDNLDVEQSA